MPHYQVGAPGTLPGGASFQRCRTCGHTDKWVMLGVVCVGQGEGVKEVGEEISKERPVWRGQPTSPCRKAGQGECICDLPKDVSDADFPQIS